MSNKFPQFYNQTLRKYIVAFGSMFNGMIVQRIDSSGTRIQTMGVPISYSPKEKFLARLTLDPNLDRPIAVSLPNMAFEITSMTYDGSRRLTGTQLTKAHNSAVPGNILAQYSPVPWNINFSLYLFVRNADDGAQLLEQILPFFGPEWTNTINIIPEMGIYGKRDVPTVLNGVSLEDVYEGDFITRRAMVYTLDFTMKGWFFGPVATSGSRTKVIKRIQLDFGIVESDPIRIGANNDITDSEAANTGRSSRVVITPGLLANGSPTSNSAASINYQLISSNTNYGIASNTFVYFDGLRYNPVTGNDE